jgi:hypothetical protein
MHVIFSLWPRCAGGAVVLAIAAVWTLSLPVASAQLVYTVPRGANAVVYGAVVYDAVVYDAVVPSAIAKGPSPLSPAAQPTGRGPAPGARPEAESGSSATARSQRRGRFIQKARVLDASTRIAGTKDVAGSLSARSTSLAVTGAVSAQALPTAIPKPAFQP